MQISRISCGLGLLMLLATTVSAQKVTVDFATDANFGRYKTFSWIKEPQPTDPLMRQRIIDDINAALTERGMTLVTSDADLAVAAHAATQEQRTLDTFYDGFGGGWRWGGSFGSATTRVNRYEVGTLVVDIFDARTKEALWRGTASKTLSSDPQKNAASLNKAVANMFKAFPPQSRMRSN